MCAAHSRLVSKASGCSQCLGVVVGNGSERVQRNAAARTIQSIWRAAQAREHVKMLEYVTKAIPVGLHVQQAAVQRESEVCLSACSA